MPMRSQDMSSMELKTKSLSAHKADIVTLISRVLYYSMKQNGEKSHYT